MILAFAWQPWMARCFPSETGSGSLPSSPLQTVRVPHGIGGIRPGCGARKGVEPSADAFNAIELEPKTMRPFNRMINAGAIAIAGSGDDVGDAGEHGYQPNHQRARVRHGVREGCAGGDVHVRAVRLCGRVGLGACTLSSSPTSGQASWSGCRLPSKAQTCARIKGYCDREDPYARRTTHRARSTQFAMGEVDLQPGGRTLPGRPSQPRI